MLLEQQSTGGVPPQLSKENPDMGMQEVAVQSYCFRGIKDNRQTAQKVKDIGLKAIELCGVHVDFGNANVFDEAIKVYKSAGVKILSIGVQGFNGDEAKERLYFEFAKKAGATTISANFSPDTVLNSYRVAEKLADEFNINLAIHNHGGRHWLGNSEILRSVFAQTSSRIGLMLDTAWALDAGEDPVGMADKFAQRLYGVHLKDFTFDRARKHKDVVVGTGNLDLKKLFATLKKNDFKGQMILEYEGDVDNPVPALSECVGNIKKELSNG
jgi:inosose dehydratase